VPFVVITVGWKTGGGAVNWFSNFGMIDGFRVDDKEDSTGVINMAGDARYLGVDNRVVSFERDCRGRNCFLKRNAANPPLAAIVDKTRNVLLLMPWSLSTLRGNDTFSDTADPVLVKASEVEYLLFFKISSFPIVEC